MAMLRSLALVSALVLCVQPLLSQPPSPSIGVKGIHQGQGKPQRDSDTPAGQHKITKDSPLFIQQTYAPKNEEDTAKEQEQKREEASEKRIGRLFNSLLVGVGFLQVVVMGLQWRVLGKQTGIAEKQSEITMNIERGILSEEIRFASDLPLETATGRENRTVAVVLLKNHGRSTVTLKSVQLRFIAFEAGERELPNIPDYEPVDRFVIKDAKGVKIPSGGDRMFLRYYERAVRITDEEIVSIYNNRMRLYCYGVVHYTDAFGRPYYLQFGQLYRNAIGNAPMFVSGFHSYGPPSYNEAN
jgi:hypothetical protein